jgi:hypothetical protein
MAAPYRLMTLAASLFIDTVFRLHPVTGFGVFQQRSSKS